MNTRRAIFLGRDGVINANRPDHVKTWDELVFLPDALAAFAQISAREFLVIVTTNQAAIGASAILALTGRGVEQRAEMRAHDHTSYAVAADLARAVEWISRREAR